MKSLILQTSGFTFNVDCVDSASEHKVALKLIFDWLQNIKGALDKKISFSQFFVYAQQKSYIVKDAVIDGNTLKGKLLGDNIEFTIDSLKSFDIRDSLDEQKIYRHALIEGEMVKQGDGDYILYSDAKKLLERIAELESRL